MLDILCCTALFVVTYVWYSLREDRSGAAGVKQAVFGALGYSVILGLGGCFCLLNAMEVFHVFFLAEQCLDVSFANGVATCRRFCYQGWSVLTQQRLRILRSEDEFAGFLGDSLELSPLNQWWDFLTSLSLDLLITDLTVSFLVACFCTLGFFFSLLLTRPAALTTSVLAYTSVLAALSVIFIFTPSLFLLLVVFECLLLVSLGLLKLTSKSERIGEAVSEMFMWTLFGSLFLFLGFFTSYVEFGGALDGGTSLTRSVGSGSGLACVFFLIGFGVKVPMWPFVSWLLKAHVEASVEFSILLSGFIVKLGILGLWRMLDALAPDFVYQLVLMLSCLAILDASLRLFMQNDLKRIVALTTVIEMNWLNLCYVLGDANLVFLAHYLLIAHCFTTTAEFLLVELISKRFGTRDFWQISGLWYTAPLLWHLSFIVIFTTMGFPGTSIFFAKFLFLSTALSLSQWAFGYFLIIFFLVLPLFFVRLWVPLWFGLRGRAAAGAADVSGRELQLLVFAAAAGCLLGLVPTFFFTLF